MNKSELKIGAMLSYFLITVNSIYGLIVTPFILSTIGTSEYGVYKTIAALSASISVLDLGIGGTVQRYIAKFNIENKRKEIENFSAMAILQGIFFSVMIIIAGIFLYISIDSLYGNTFNNEQLIRAKELMVLLLVNMVLIVFENIIIGIISGMNKFIFTNSVKLVSIISRILLLFVFLPIFNNSITIVALTLFLEALVLLVEIFYVIKILNTKIKYHFWDMIIFKESFKYTIFLFIQSVMSQVNMNLDNIVIGSIIGPDAVTVYSVGILIFNMFQQLSTAISNLMLPTTTLIIAKGATSRDLENFVIRVGRLQFLLLGAATLGFIILGKEFILLWMGKGFNDAWIITVILIIPALFELSQNVCLSVLRAKNKLGFRTLVIGMSTILNLFITIVGTKYFGYYAAALGTSLSTIIGSLVIMNIYYLKRFNINAIYIFRNIFKKIFLCQLLPCISLIIFNMYIYNSWKALVFKMILYCLIYLFLLYFYGFNNEEKKFFKLKELGK
ncbi:MAG: oligosaccharide flippase family protein [Thomasclavelia sp.]|uniref:oligosaccharide flippase family protein n=1 Tax=Thomasclavelia sp. TaxID=3025757 RepID=UPI0039A35B96